MGRQAYPIIGGIIGAAVAFVATDGTASWQGYQAGFAIGAAIGGVAGSYIDPILLTGNKIGDTQLQVAAEGGARAIVFGRGCVTATCIVARGNRVVTKKKQSNGKGSSGSTQNETVSWTFAIAIGEAILGGSISRIWQDENLVYDVLSDSSMSPEDNAKFFKKFRFYDGNEAQLPDPDLQVFLEDDTPYFRGTAYVVFPNFDLTNTAERIPTFKFEVTSGSYGVVEQISTLRWDIPNPFVSVGSDQSITLGGFPDTTYVVDLHISGNMETRNYSHITARVGGGGRFIAAPDAFSATTPTYNAYMLTISDPPQKYFVNSFLEGETTAIQWQPNGDAMNTIRVEIAGNATIRYLADPQDGFSDPSLGPQFGSTIAEMVSVIGVADDPSSLSTIVASLLRRAGMTDDQFDVSALTDTIAGVCIQETVNATDAINACVQAFFADPCEVDGVLTWVKRGAPALRTLTLDDLTEVPDISTRENVIEYPGKMSFFYQSPQTGYAATKATSHRYSAQADSSSEGSVSAPVTFFDPDEPARIAAKLHKVSWTEAEGSFEWRVGAHCLDLVPTDCVALYLRDIAVRARIIATEYDNQGGTILLTLMKDRQSSYTSNVTGLPLPLPTPPQPTTMSPSVLAVMDVPALLDSDDQLCYYLAVSGETRVWHGAQLQRSLDSGTTWVTIADAVLDVTMGRLTTALPAADRRYTDDLNAFDVQLFDDRNELHSFTDTQFLQEQGAIAVQLADGSWEILQYRDAVDNGAGAYTLSYFQRGRKNTISGAHAVGALFVLLETDILKFLAQTAWIGGHVQHRAVSYDTSSEDAIVVDITYAGRSQQAWSPATVDVSFSAGNLTISNLNARHRFGTEVAPVPSTNDIGFRVTMTDGTSTVVADIIGVDTVIPTAPLSTVTTVSIAALNKYTGPSDPLVITL